MSATRVATSDGVELALHELSAGPGLALFTHAAGLCGGMLAPLAEHLRPVTGVLAVDLRGHGSSSRPRDGNYAWSRVALDLVEVLDALDEPVNAFGHSVGASALLIAAAARPTALRSLYLYEPVIAPPGPASDAAMSHAERALRRRRRFDSPRAAIDRFSSGPPFDSVLPELVATYVDCAFRPAADGSVGLVLSPEDEATLYRESANVRLEDALVSLRVPTTIARGARSTDPAAEAGVRLVTAVTGVRPVVFEDLGHFGPLEDPEEVARSVSTTFGTPPV